MKDLKKFDENISEVIKSCKGSEEISNEIKPFDGLKTPERSTEKMPEVEES